MSPASRVVGAGLLLLLALVLQLTVLSRVPTAATPAPVLVVVVCVALVAGASRGAVVGFAGGLALDAWGDHPIGVLALVLTLVGYVAGGVAPSAEGRGVAVPAGVVAVATAFAPVLFAVLTAALGEPRASFGSLVRTIPLSVVYNLLLVPVVFPFASALRERSRRSRRLP